MTQSFRAKVLLFQLFYKGLLTTCHCCLCSTGGTTHCPGSQCLTYICTWMNSSQRQSFSFLLKSLASLIICFLFVLFSLLNSLSIVMLCISELESVWSEEGFFSAWVQLHLIQLPSASIICILFLYFALFVIPLFNCKLCFKVLMKIMVCSRVEIIHFADISSCLCAYYSFRLSYCSSDHLFFFVFFNYRLHTSVRKGQYNPIISALLWGQL